ncbi:MAG: 4'-phosphopantetheinyl transferase superfamily protein, partial [Clostridia bacterium]|nr:4'-phosphopantetheinyl transferase superfamily protein [Clostridia bacterium]
KPVGVDIELPSLFGSRYACRADKLDALKRKVYTAREKRAESVTAEDFLVKWTRKEAIYKRGGTGVFRPHRIEADDPLTVTYRTQMPEEMILSVCGEQVRAVRFYLCRDGAAELLPPSALEKRV